MGTSQSGPFADFVRGRAFANIILATVFLNACVIGLQSYPHLDGTYGALFRTLDLVFLSIFAVEIILKLIVFRFGYFKDGWNVFDFVIVSASLLFMGSQFVSVLRILRVLRVLKTISAIRSLRRVTASLFMAVPSIGSIALLMILVFFIYAVIGTTFFASAAPVYFGDLGKALITLFQIATFDDWANIYRPIAENAPLSLAYFISFIFIAVFIMLNLVVGEIVNNAANIQEDVSEIEKDVQEIKLEGSELTKLRREVMELKMLLLEERKLRKDDVG